MKIKEHIRIKKSKSTVDKSLSVYSNTNSELLFLTKFEDDLDLQYVAVFSESLSFVNSAVSMLAAFEQL